ncbi:MAG TPA: hypothetical protein DEB31_02810, partial [Clostridiales bacterium]|nr:hypothetical protein [Clostridiales bacterium]
LTAVGEGAPASLFVEEGVVAAGHVPDASLDRFYETSRVAVVPILTGGGVTGKTVEAMAHGLPFVSTAAGLAGLPAAGQVAQPADTVEAFAAQVVQKYLDKAEWEKTSDAYRKYLREFASFKEAERIWKKILANAAER